uniref:DUF223 domain-containing protein n=1 Tax=Lactuca sativa TaxID=4236 RepID=A0A9R1W0F4_LACSA|nr:hypothetical protein LSAT_V11C300142060 [Lactuca sativa]
MLIDPFNFVSFHDLTAINFDTRVAFCEVIKENARETRLMSIVAQDLSYISEHQNENAPVIILLYMAKLKTGGQPQVGNCLFGSRLHINDDMHHISEFKKAYEIGLSIIDTIIGFDLEEGWYSFYCRDCSKKVTKNGDDSDGEPFNCNVSNVFGKARVVIFVQDETEFASFVLFDHHIKDLIHRGNHWLIEKISKDQGRQKIPDEFNTMLNRKFNFKFNLENNYHAYTVHKMTNDELVVGAVFKHSPAYEENNINSDATPVNNIFVEGGNINVVDLDAVTPTTTSLKRPIEIVTTTESFEWSSSRDGVSPHTLKIPKMEKDK